MRTKVSFDKAYANAGGHFAVKPTWAFRTKQAYAPNSNVLVTKFLSDQGVLVLTDFLVPKGANKTGSQSRAFLPWLVRKVESIRGTIPVRMECAPAFNYCRDKHTAALVVDDTVSSENGHRKALFETPSLNMDLRYVTFSSDTCVADPKIELQVEDLDRPLLGPAVTADFELDEGQAVYFVFRETGEWEYATEEHQRFANPKPERAETLGVPLEKLLDATSRLRPKQNPLLTKVRGQMIRLIQALLHALHRDTLWYWQTWISKSKYKGKWREDVERSALVL